MLESAHARGLAAKEVQMASYAEQVGERLRNIRLQKGLSLHDVEERSGKEFKASVLGAYERGERSISVPRLQRLAIRRDDVRVLAAILDQSPGGLIEWLDDLGLRRPSFG